jgi:predicted DsbA family dithiol-disulfide isomerase
MIIDIFQDFVCPWCRIGKKHLLQAVEQWEKTQAESVTIRYRAFLLDPEMPEGGRPFEEVMLKKLGSPEMLTQVIERVTEAGARSGILFDFSKVTVMPNTFLAHALIKKIPERKVGEMAEAIFRAYFEEGKDIGSREILVEVARETGLEPHWVMEALADESVRKEVEADLNLAARLGIRGVPFFVLDGKLAMSGAHPVENFLQALDAAAGK